MTAASKDEEVRKVVAELDGLLAELHANVDALTAVLRSKPSPENSRDQGVRASDRG